MGKEKPADGKYTRKGEKDGKRLTPGERFLNWCKGLAVIIPLLGIGAIADEPIKRFFTGQLEEVDGHTELTENQTFEQAVIKFSQETRAELETIKEHLERLEAQRSRGDQRLAEDIKKLQELVN